MSIEGRDQNQVLAWGKLAGLLMQHSDIVDLTMWQEDGYYADFIDLRFRDGSTTIRIRLEGADPIDATKSDLKKLLGELDP